MEPFVDKHREELIRKVTKVDPILDELKDLLKKENYEYLKSRQTSKEKMEALFGYVSGWNESYKDRLYELLKKHDEEIIRDLEKQERDMKPFVDRHREELLSLATVVDPILNDIKDLLTTEHYEFIRSRPTSREKMEALFGYVSGWSDGDKEILYKSLKIHNESIIRDLEEEEICSSHPDEDVAYLYSRSEGGRPRGSSYQLPPGTWSDLYEGSAGVRDDDEVPPRPGRALALDLRFKQKGKKKTAGEELRHKKSFWKEQAPELLFQKGKGKKNIPDKESTSNILSSPDFHLDCKLCGKDQDSAYLVMPDINEREYRLELQSAGLFRCSNTGIQFHVTRPATIVYELESWRNYETLICNLQSGYEILGPLFNIKTDLEPGVISAVHLPHCLCLKGFKGDISLIKCAHFKYDNITLEAPTRVEPYYVVLENPSFSPIGVLLYPMTWLTWLKERITKLVPFHGMVLIYWRISGKTNSDNRKFRIHLYLMPCNLSFEKDIHKHEEKVGYDRIHKPPQTASLYNERTYAVKASQEARVLPKTLQFRCSYVSELFPYTEITVDGKNANEGIAISVKDGKTSIWKAMVDREDIEDLENAMSELSVQEVLGPAGCLAGPSLKEPCVSRQSTEMLRSDPVKGGPADLSASREHFVDKYRSDLICAISLVEPILEELLSLDLLTDEQYDAICSKPTSQEQMRELYRYIRNWGNGDKDKVYQSLRKHNRPIINRLGEMAGVVF